MWVWKWVSFLYLTFLHPISRSFIVQHLTVWFSSAPLKSTSGPPEWHSLAVDQLWFLTRPHRQPRWSKSRSASRQLCWSNLFADHYCLFIIVSQTWRRQILGQKQRDEGIENRIERHAQKPYRSLVSMGVTLSARRTLSDDQLGESWAHLTTRGQAWQLFRFGARGTPGHSGRLHYALDGPYFSISMCDSTSYTSSTCKTRRFPAQSLTLSADRRKRGHLHG